MNEIEWLRKLEGDVDRLEDKFQKITDEIKNTIRFEVAVLKTEAIADLRRRVDDGYRTLEKYDERLRMVEKASDAAKAEKGLVGWLINAAIGVGSAVAGYLGAKHL